MRLPVYKLKLSRCGWATYPGVSFGHVQVAALFFHRLIGQADREHSAALFLDVRRQPLGASILSIGELSSTPLSAREVFKSALMANAASLVLAHNHPSGIARASHADIRITKELVKLGELLDVPVRDHIIVTPSGSFVSMMEEGLLSEPDPEPEPPQLPEQEPLQLSAAESTAGNFYDSEGLDGQFLRKTFADRQGRETTPQLGKGGPTEEQGEIR